MQAWICDPPAHSQQELLGILVPRLPAGRKKKKMSRAGSVAWLAPWLASSASGQHEAIPFRLCLWALACMPSDKFVMQDPARRHARVATRARGKVAGFPRSQGAERG